MALKPILSDEPEAPAAPDPAELLAQERAERVRLENEMRERQAAWEGRVDQMERDNRRAQQPPISASQAQKELGLSAEDIAKDPNAALAALEEHIRARTTAEIEQKYGGMVQGLAQQAFQSEIESLKNRKYWANAEKEVIRYFQDNPHEALTPGRAKQVYNYLVGQNVESYEGEAKAQAFTAARLESSTAEPPMRRPEPVVKKEEEDDVKLSEEEELVRQKYNAYGANISRREWRAISEGKVFPKTQSSADWEKGWVPRENRKVRGLDY